MEEKKRESRLPTKVEEARKYVSCEQEGPRNVNYFGSATTFSSVGIDNTFNYKRFQQGLKIKILQMDDQCVVFDLIGEIDAAVANAFRRILIAEVATVALDQGSFKTRFSCTVWDCYHSHLSLIY
eukprot:Trichotokara_eunicae@DN170_c0_g1_i1.p1